MKHMEEILEIPWGRAAVAVVTADGMAGHKAENLEFPGRVGNFGDISRP
ncbi:hypothetical protein ACFZCY_40605 [Streptomyces sp. NPDC007983]